MDKAFLQGNSGMLFQLVHSSLQAVIVKADAMGAAFHIVQSWRDPAAQLAAYKSGHSKAKPGQSPHNFKPSLAIDFIPVPFIGWGNIEAFRTVAHTFLAAGGMLGIPVTWGGDWNHDGSEADERGLRDFGHIELRNWRALRK